MTEPDGATGRASAAAVAEAIRRNIVGGDYAPGQRLVEADLSEAYDASRGVVRAALFQLEHEGLVERIPHRGARVRQVSIEEAVRLMEVRRAVEGLCAYRAAENVTDAQISELRTLGTAMREAVAQGETMTYSQLNTELHGRIRAIADQPVATEVLDGLQARIVRFRIRLALLPGRPQVSLPEHLALIDEICARDPDAAERAARRHVASVIETLRTEFPQSS